MISKFVLHRITRCFSNYSIRKALFPRTKELILLLVRFEDWVRNDTSELGEQILKLEENYERLVNLLRGWSSPTPCFMGIFPASRPPAGIDRLSE